MLPDVRAGYLRKFAAGKGFGFYILNYINPLGSLNRYFNFILVLLLCTAFEASAQLTTPAGSNNLGNDPNNPFASDTTNGKKKMGEDWINEQAKITYNYYNSSVKHYPDTTIHSFHHYQNRKPWWGRDLGNIASPTYNMLYTPEQLTGPQLGYHVWDMHMITLDSLPFYNTTRPYSSFQFMLGSKTEQRAEIMHTQNINPDWNFSFRFRNINSPGFYQLQPVTSNCGSFNTQYASENQKYRMAAAFVYNKFNHDENGGIENDSFLTASAYSNRALIPTNYSPGRNAKRSFVANSLRSWDFYVQNSYAWGKADTLYNEDSTSATYQFTPRFRLKHQLQLHNEKHIYKDTRPDSARYAKYVDTAFASNDTLQSTQNWFYVENKFSLNGYLGSGQKLALVEVGIGNRVDNFSEDFRVDKASTSTVSNYLFGQIQKEALEEGQWSYKAAARFFFTGFAAGDFDINGSVGKTLKNIGGFDAGIRQTLSVAPYAWEHFRTEFFEVTNELNKRSVTNLWANINISKLNIVLGVRNYLMANYLYYNKDWEVQQQSEAFSVLQFYGKKLFVYRSLRFDNEVIYQQPTANAPVNLPAFMLRHQLSVEMNIVKALRVAAGVEVRYHTPYYADGYAPLFNQFYVQNDIRIANPIVATLFANFRVGNFRCFVTGDQMQQMLIKKNVINAPGYPAQNALFRFGFNWVLVN